MMQVTKVWWDGEKLMAEPIDPASVYKEPEPDIGFSISAQQEPYCYTYTENGEEYFAPPTAYVPDDAKPLYTSPPAQRTREEWFKWWRTSKVADSTEAEIDFADFMLIARAVESEYGIKEKNT